MARLIENKSRKFGSPESYFQVDDGNEPLLFTASEIERAKARTAANVEDILPKEEVTQDAVSLQGCLGLILAFVGIATAIIGFMYLTK